MAEDYKWKVDLNFFDVTIGTTHQQLLDIIAYIIKQAHQEANMPYDESEIEEFVNENCFIKFVYANIPFSFKIIPPPQL